jgi:hypothetical protein
MELHLSEPAAGDVAPQLSEDYDKPISTIPQVASFHDPQLDQEVTFDSVQGMGSPDSEVNCDSYENDQELSSCLDWILPRSNLSLPLMKGLAEDLGVTLPLPIGTSVIWTEIDRQVAVSDVRLGLGTTPPVSANRISIPTTKLHASTQIFRGDIWLLPFVNLYGIVGTTHSKGSVDVTVGRFPFPFSPPLILNVPVDLEGPTAGWGTTAIVGTKSIFASLDVNKTWTKFSRLESSLTALVVTPRIGFVIDRPAFKGEIHTGAMWQDTNQTVTLTIDHPVLGPGLTIEADQFEPNPWNFLVGGLYRIDERLHLFVEGGTGGRSYIVSGITVRY